MRTPQTYHGSTTHRIIMDSKLEVCLSVCPEGCTREAHCKANYLRLNRRASADSRNVIKAGTWVTDNRLIHRPLPNHQNLLNSPYLPKTFTLTVPPLVMA